MRILPRIAALIAMSAIAGAPVQAASTVKLGPNPVLSGGEYSTGGGITVAVELREIGGQAHICGVWAESERLTAYVRRKGRDVLARGKVELNGRTLTHDLGFLRQVPAAESYAGAPAGCMGLGRAWQTGDAGRKPRVRIPRQLVVFERDGSGAGGIEITFRQTSTPNPALTSGSILPKNWTTFTGTPPEPTNDPDK